MRNARAGAIIVVMLLGSGCASTNAQRDSDASGGSSGVGARNGSAGGGAAGGAGGAATTGGSEAGAGGNVSGGGSGGLAGTGGTSGGAATSGGPGSAGSTGACQPPSDVFSPITVLSQTGCVDPTDPRKPVSSAISYEVNSPLWSDSADKQRAFVLPPGMTIHVRDCAANPSECPGGIADDGRWDFPVGAVMIKIFMFDTKLVETRLFMHVDADNWVGYSYEWDESADRRQDCLDRPRRRHIRHRHAQRRVALPKPGRLSQLP